MPNINDRIGSQNVIRVLSNASAPPTRLVNLSDVDSTLKTRDGMILVWDLSTETFYMTDTIDSSTLVATGIVTFSNTTNSSSTTTGALIISGGVGIDKNINVGGNANIGGDLSITGLSTFSENVDINANADILYSLTVNSTFKSVGVTTLASNGGITTTGGNLFVEKNLYVKGTSEFIGVATFRGGTINLGDSTGDDINVGGEFISDLNPNNDATYDIGIDSKRWRNGRFSGLVTTNNLYVSGVSTFVGDVNFDGDIDIDGHLEVDNLRVSGFSTFLSQVDVNASLDIQRNFAVAGISTFGDDLNINASVDIQNDLVVNDDLRIIGVSTFESNVDINNSVDISDNLVINGTLESVGITTLASSGGTTELGGDLYVTKNATVNQNLKVNGTSEFIGVATFRGGTIRLGDANTDDINVGGEFISNLTPNDDATYDLGIDSKRWSNARLSGLLTTNNLYVSGVSTFTNDLDISGDLRITGFASVTEGLYYDLGDYDGPNGVAYFDNTGKLIGAASTENALTESYFVLTTNSVGIPTWTSVIDGGVF